MGRPAWQMLRGVRLDPARVADFDAFPFSMPAVRALADGIDLHPGVTFLVGENGSGKSTVIEALAAKLDLDAEGGDTVTTFVERNADTPLHEALVLSRGPRRPSMRYFLRAESFYNVARHVDSHPGALEGLYGGRPLLGMSHGESFLTLVRERFHPDGLFVLDEPEAALSAQGAMTFLRHMHQLVTEGAQFVVATHSPILLAYPGALIHVLDESGITPTEYRDTQPYRLTRAFLDAPERFLRELLD